SIGILALIVVVLNLKLTGAPWEEAASLPRSLGVWAGLLVVSLAIGVWTMSRKARRIGQVFWSPVLRKALWGYASGMLLGGILTVAVIRSGAPQFLPIIWLGCYGVAVLSAGAMSVSPVRWMGVCFLLLAAVASWLDVQFFGLPLLAVGFGWLHISFGTYIAWRHDG
ncbi:MAG: hypothetical protein HY046_00495, partial [Acidobacteria bacterium]|nr:hypothetical protein [Acidobacteriota bacterium]